MHARPQKKIALANEVLNLVVIETAFDIVQASLVFAGEIRETPLAGRCVTLCVIRDEHMRHEKDLASRFGNQEGDDRTH